jgi:multisubunit Na+/H+ antiporter MnhB subunit
MVNKTELLFSRPENIGTPTNFFIEYLATITDGVWPIGIAFLSFALVYLNLNDYNARKAYGAASFVNFVVTTALVALGAFDSGALIIAILMVVIGVVIN